MSRERPLSGLGIQFYQQQQQQQQQQQELEADQHRSQNGNPAPGIERGQSSDSNNTDRRVRITDDSPVVVGYGGEDNLTATASDESELDEDDASIVETETVYGSQPVPFPSHQQSPPRRRPESVASSNGSGLSSRRLNRPTSMLELSRLSALQSLERSAPPAVVPSHRRQISHSTLSESSFALSQASVPMRSRTSMIGLESAEIGASTIQLDTLRHGFKRGSSIEPTNASAFRSPSVAVTDDDSSALKRNSTLLTTGAPPGRRAKELNRILLAKADKGPVILEQAKNGKGRVEVDLTLDSGLVVEGGLLKGRMEVRVKKEKAEVWLGKPKVRVVGFEGGFPCFSLL
jgi:hypothetical protein